MYNAHSDTFPLVLVNYILYVPRKLLKEASIDTWVYNCGTEHENMSMMKLCTIFFIKDSLISNKCNLSPLGSFLKPLNCHTVRVFLPVCQRLW